MASLLVKEHRSSSYGPRTWENASRGDVTVAFAVDFQTAGEKLTHKASGEKYIGLPISTELMTSEHAVQCARKLFAFARSRKCRCLNVAGNGIYTLSQHGMTQRDVNQFVASVVKKVHEHWPLSLVVSGGQTGVDVAGGVAALVAGIPAELTLPKGFVQRGTDKVDRMHAAAEIEAQVVAGAREVEAMLLI